MLTASDAAYERIKALIVSGALGPGAQLKEEELAERCGVSRTPVRAAMNRLESELFIERSDSKRAFVADWLLPDVEELFKLRTLLESHAAARAAARVTPAALATFEGNVAATRRAIELPRPDVDAFLALNAEFHALLTATSASGRLATMINTLVVQPVVQRTARRYGPDQLRRSLAEHAEIVTALAARDPDWAAAVMTSHIRRAFHVYRAGGDDAGGSDAGNDAAA